MIQTKARLGDVVDFRYGQGLPASARVEGPVPVFGSGGLVGRHSEACVVGPVLVLARKGSIGAIYWVPSNAYPIDTTYWAAPGAEVDKRWLYYWLHTVDFRGLSSGSGVPSLRRDDLNDLEISLPPKRQQQKIAEVLGALDDKIAANRRAAQTGRELILAQWSRLVSDAEETREWSTFVETNPKVPAVKDGTAPYLDMKNLPENGLLVEEWGERPPQGGARFQNGDTLFARITPCFENRKHGYVDFLDDGEVGYGSTEYIVFRAREGVSAAIPFVVTATADFRSFAAQHRTGTSGRQRVQAPDLVSYEAAWPGDLRAVEFGAFAEPLIARLGAARDENRVLAKTRDELLPLLMSGKITVRDAEKRVEGVV
ncbi:MULTISPECIES: restriction endonuclease subunit S [Dermacoccus]|uniref:Restriction endonuclease subunit S n=1 Tax=Dermacoccus profundi TaxID=322602 RepID=A0ABP4P1G4_9MICO|nr:restriction endonuclease subunit S [Dermacoccus abyssi]